MSERATSFTRSAACHDELWQKLTRMDFAAAKIDPAAGEVVAWTSAAQSNPCLCAYQGGQQDTFAQKCLSAYEREFNGTGLNPTLQLDEDTNLILNPEKDDLYAILRPKPPSNEEVERIQAMATPVLSQLPEGTFLISGQGDYFYIHGFFTKSISVPVHKKTVYSDFHFNSLSKTLWHLECVQEVLKTGNPKTVEDNYSSPRPDLCLSTTLSPFQVPGVEIPLVVGVSQDITRQKQAERNLRQQNSSRDLLFRQLPGIIWSTDTNLTFTLSEGKGLSSIETAPGGLVGRTLDEVLAMDPNHAPRIKEAWEQGLKGHKFTLQTHFAGHDFEIHGEPLVDTNGKIIGLIGMSLDVSDLVRMQQSLSESQRRLAEAQTIAQVGSFDWDVTNKIFRWTPELRRITGCEDLPEVVPVEVAWKSIHPDDIDRIRKEAHAAIKNGTNYELEYRVLRPDGEIRHVFARCFVFVDEKDKTERIAGVIMDITDRKRIEAELHRARAEAEAANRAKSEFLANISHEVRTPLTPILGLVELMRETVTDPETSEYIDIIDESANRLLLLINDVLDISRIEAGRLRIEPSSFELSTLLKRLMRQTTFSIKSKEVEFRSDFAKDLPRYIETDFSRLTQVIGNLLTNAAKFTHKGSITLAARVLEQGSSTSILRFSVIDTGIGIDPNQQERIFEPFQQAASANSKKYGGTGLGLAISRRIVEVLGGRIHLQSEPGKGSAFHVDLPVAVKDHIHGNDDSDDESEEPLLSSRVPLRILLAEDDETNCRVAVEMLKNLGYDVKCVTDGRQACEAARTSEYDLVIMDLHMPVLDGVAATKELLKEPRFRDGQARIVGFSANAFPEEKQKCIDLGMADYVSKPATIQSFRSLVERLYPEAFRA